MHAPKNLPLLRYTRLGNFWLVKDMIRLSESFGELAVEGDVLHLRHQIFKIDGTDK
jgi:hypothetical protein